MSSFVRQPYCININQGCSQRGDYGSPENFYERYYL